MCGRFVVSDDDEQILTRFENIKFEKTDLPNYPNFNIAPTNKIGIITRSLKDDGSARYSSARWGLVPQWAESLDIGTRMINARSEKALNGPVYKDLIKSRRCIIPVNAWYEWMPKPSGGKQPYALRLPETFYFAGLYDFWRANSSSAWQLSATILTQAATFKASEVHERMPVMLTSEQIDSWLNIEHPAKPALDEALANSETHSKSLEIWKVSPRVNRVSENSAELLEKYAPEGLDIEI